MIINDFEIFGMFMLMLAKLGIDNDVMHHIYDDDGPYFALTKAEHYVNKLKKRKV